MGVEPTAARSARPANDFEDRGSHRTTTIPGFGRNHNRDRAISQLMIERNQHLDG